MIVVDASVLATVVADDADAGERFRARLVGETLVAPHLIDLEVANAVRKATASGRLDERRALQAVRDLAAFPVRRAAHRRRLARIWELRENVSPYDAAYVALAETLEAVLLTADARLARAPGIRCTVEVLA